MEDANRRTRGRAIRQARERIEESEKLYPDTVAEEQWARAIGEPASHQLSPRELQVVTGVSYGLTDKMIGELYNISPHTVKTHIRRLQSKLKSKNRTHAACEALRRELIR